MKRDLDLIRKILLEIESCENSGRKVNSGEIVIRIKEYNDDNFILYHLKLLNDVDFITGDPMIEIGTPHGSYRQVKLILKGRRFLDTVRSDALWKATKEEIGGKLESVSFEVLELHLLTKQL